MGLKPGELARRTAVDLLHSILKRRQSFEDAFAEMSVPEIRDRAFVHALVLTALRRKGEIDHILGRFLPRPLPARAGVTDLILLAGAAQLLHMDVPAHAAIDLAVTVARRDPDARHFAKLVNAVLRKVAAGGASILAGLDQARLDTPDWLWQRWLRTYGEASAHAITSAHLDQPALDLSAKCDAAGWAERLGGMLLPTGTIRIEDRRGAIEALPGFKDGAWWVQDAAARLPALLPGDVAGKRVLDLCAAPGGKTAQLAASGARVTAVDRSPARMERLRENLDRLHLSAETIIADAETFAPADRFDAVLLDAPCSATGTIRHHPDLPHTKDEAQIASLSALQARLLVQAAKLVSSGGMLVYSTCSLEPEEGEAQADRFLTRNRQFRRLPLNPSDVAGQGQFINQNGDLRTLPSMAIGGARGLDGFFAARFVRS
jgi:16S rRNA (cytosine967-C5)-methyltransferase